MFFIAISAHEFRQVNEIIMSPPASASQLDNYLMKIADTYQVPWKPEPRREDMCVAVYSNRILMLI